MTRADKAVHDLLPDLRAGNGWITDKPEGFTVARPTGGSHARSNELEVMGDGFRS